MQGDRVLESSIISISAERDWYPVTPGPDGAIIPLTAWSSAPFGPWFVSATASSFSVRVDDVGAPPTPTIVGDDFLPGVENGDPLNLLVTAKPGTPSGTWEVVYARSSPLAAHRGADLALVWPVGIYVP